MSGMEIENYKEESWTSKPVDAQQVLFLSPALVDRYPLTNNGFFDT